MATTKILVADPEPMICELIAAVFDAVGMQVVAVGTAPEGLTALLTESFDLAIIEAMLPGGAGINLATVAADEQIPALLMSGHPSEILRLHALGFPFIQKPSREGPRRESGSDHVSPAPLSRPPLERGKPGRHMIDPGAAPPIVRSLPPRLALSSPDRLGQAASEEENSCLERTKEHDQ